MARNKRTKIILREEDVINDDSDCDFDNTHTNAEDSEYHEDEAVKSRKTKKATRKPATSSSFSFSSSSPSVSCKTSSNSTPTTSPDTSFIRKKRGYHRIDMPRNMHMLEKLGVGPFIGKPGHLTPTDFAKEYEADRNNVVRNRINKMDQYYGKEVREQLDDLFIAHRKGANGAAKEAFALCMKYYKGDVPHPRSPQETAPRRAKKIRYRTYAKEFCSKQSAKVAGPEPLVNEDVLGEVHDMEDKVVVQDAVIHARVRAEYEPLIDWTVVGTGLFHAISGDVHGPQDGMIVHEAVDHERIQLEDERMIEWTTVDTGLAEAILGEVHGLQDEIVGQEAAAHQRFQAGKEIDWTMFDKRLIPGSEAWSVADVNHNHGEYEVDCVAVDAAVAFGAQVNDMRARENPVLDFHQADLYFGNYDYTLGEPLDRNVDADAILEML